MANPLALNDIREAAFEFVREWRDAPGYEEGDAAPFVIKLFQVFGVDKAISGVFEQRARRASKDYAHGRIDALTDDVIIEMKSVGKDLAEAEQQAIDYLPSLPKLGIKVPRFVLTSDFKKFRLLDLAGDTRVAIEFSLSELPREIERLQFLAGYEPPKLGNQAHEDASIKAAKIMADLYKVLATPGHSDEDASIFMVRILFCLYADDAGVWPRDRFTDFILTRTSPDGSDLGDRSLTRFPGRFLSVDHAAVAAGM